MGCWHEARFTIEETGIIIICENCGYKQIRWEYPLKAYQMLQRFFDRGNTETCSECGGKIKKVLQLKKEVIEKLKVKFPEKRVIYTKESLENLI